MTQTIVDNAAQISFDRDLTVAQTTSASRNIKWFRKGPIQSIFQVQLNPVIGTTYRTILGSLSDNLVGTYTLSFPEEAVGPPLRGLPDDAVTNRITTRGTPSGVTLTIQGVAALNGMGAVLTPGQVIKIDGVLGSYIVLNSVNIGSSGEGSITLDQPLFSTPQAGSRIRVGPEINFDVNLVNRPRAGFGPTGIVTHSGPFIFSENLQ